MALVEEAALLGPNQLNAGSIGQAGLGFTRQSGACMTETTLKLTILDAGTQEPTPARVDVVDAVGRCYMAEDALPTGGD